MYNRTMDFFSGLTAFLIIIIVITAPFIYDSNYSQEPQETPKNANMSVLECVTHLPVGLEFPDVSYPIEFKANKEKAKEKLDGALVILTAMDTVTLPKAEMVLTSLGTYYITGYTSIECGGSTMTASGATVHKGNPTTCAIDPALHDFGDLFYIEYFDTVYVAEDTGSAVKGKHLDLYFYDDEYNYALSITGYYEVFSVEYVYSEVQATNYDIQKLVADKNIGWKIKGT